MYVCMYIPALWLARVINTGLWLVRNVCCSMHWTPARTLCLSFRALSSKYQGQENLIFTLNTSESMRYVVSFSPPGPNVAPFILSSSDPQLFLLQNSHEKLDVQIFFDLQYCRWQPHMSSCLLEIFNNTEAIWTCRLLRQSLKYHSFREAPINKGSFNVL